MQLKVLTYVVAVVDIFFTWKSDCMMLFVMPFIIFCTLLVEKVAQTLRIFMREWVHGSVFYCFVAVFIHHVIGAHVITYATFCINFDILLIRVYRIYCFLFVELSMQLKSCNKRITVRKLVLTFRLFNIFF